VSENGARANGAPEPGAGDPWEDSAPLRLGGMALRNGLLIQALITTETGLVIALPGLFLQYQLARQHARYKAFLAHLQTVCTQSLYRHLRKQ
jgi:hypothetical protein